MEGEVSRDAATYETIEPLGKTMQATPNFNVSGD